jgi:hypothetical protein
MGQVVMSSSLMPWFLYTSMTPALLFPFSMVYAFQRKNETPVPGVTHLPKKEETSHRST